MPTAGPSTSSRVRNEHGGGPGEGQPAEPGDAAGHAPLQVGGDPPRRLELGAAIGESYGRGAVASVPCGGPRPVVVGWRRRSPAPRARRVGLHRARQLARSDGTTVAADGTPDAVDDQHPHRSTQLVGAVGTDQPTPPHGADHDGHRRRRARRR